MKKNALVYNENDQFDIYSKQIGNKVRSENLNANLTIRVNYSS